MEQTAWGAAGSCAVLCWELSAATQGSLCHRCQLQFTFPSMNTSEGKVSEALSRQRMCGAEQCLQQLLSVVLHWLQGAGGVLCLGKHCSAAARQWVKLGAGLKETRHKPQLLFRPPVIKCCCTEQF